MEKRASVGQRRRGGRKKSLLLGNGGEVDAKNRVRRAAEASGEQEGFFLGCAQRFSLAAALLTPCKIRLLFTRRGWAPLLDLLRKSHLPSGVRLRRCAPRLTPASRFLFTAR